MSDRIDSNRGPKSLANWFIRSFSSHVTYKFEQATLFNEMGSFALRAYPARLPFGGINVKNGFGRTATIRTNRDLIVDCAVDLIEKALVDLKYKPANREIISSLLLRRKFQYRGLAVHDDDIIHTLECLHVYEKLKLNFDELKEDWEKLFEKTVARRHEPNGILNINGAALGLFKEILTEYGGYNSRIFGEQHARVALKRAASNKETINAREFSKAVADGIMKVTDYNRIVLPNATNVAALVDEFSPNRRKLRRGS